jgi:hypothetical protein
VCIAPHLEISPGSLVIKWSISVEKVLVTSVWLHQLTGIIDKFGARMARNGLNLIKDIAVSLIFIINLFQLVFKIDKKSDDESGGL